MLKQPSANRYATVYIPAISNSKATEARIPVAL
jgi:hypothetical protein